MDNIIIDSDVKVDNYVDYVCQKYDIQDNSHYHIEIPRLDMDELKSFDWNIGVICGNSGSGKSTILHDIGEVRTPQYDISKAVCSQFDGLSEQEVCNLLTSVGLSSVPLWLHTPNQLSNGETARLDLAWQLHNANMGNIILIDEFTSVVNRQCAQSMSFALQRYARNKNLKIILATCHFDLFEHLQPDWVFNLNKYNNGKVELERLVYSDSKDYEVYKDINPKDVLTNEQVIF